MTLAEQIERLTTLSAAQLKSEWGRVLKTPAPALSPDLMARAIAYRLEERLHGGLSTSVRREITKLARQVEQTGEVAADREVVLKPGTLLVREWHGKAYRVLVLEDGFMFEERRFASLSQIARAITGAGWSGPRFFDVKRRSNPFASVARE